MRALDVSTLLGALSWARLAVAGLLLAVGPLLPAGLVPAANRQTLVIAVSVAVTVSAAVLLLGPFGRPRRIAWLVNLLDVVLVTAIIASTGGARSIFTFLYVLSVTAACMLLSRVGGLVIAAASSVLYATLVFGHTMFPLAYFLEAPSETSALEVLTIFLNSGTFLVVAIVAGGLVERFTSTHRELETRRRDLSDLQAFKDLIFTSVGTGLVAVDAEQRITAFNRAAEEITGIPADRAIGEPWAALFGTSIALDTVEAQVAKDPRHARYETELRREDGAQVPVRIAFSALLAGDGARIGLIAACEDLSAIREMEERIRQADRLASLGRMAANIAHEIRNPLASLTGAIEALSTQPSDDSRERLTQIVLRESDRLNELIRNFLDYARPVPLAVVDPVNVAQIVDDVLVLLEHRPLPPGLKIVRELSPADWRLDPQQFRQAVWNLCLNAVDAMPDGGELRAGVATEAGILRVSVTDTGEGIAPVDLPQVFDPFFSTKTAGSGLGLALVHRIVRDHGGWVDVRSTPGSGTTFTLCLPECHG